MGKGGTRPGICPSSSCATCYLHLLHHLRILGAKMADVDPTSKSWIPPTPQSILVPLKGPSPPPLVRFEPLPPPLSTIPPAAPSPTHWERRDTPRGLAGLLNADVAAAPTRATPSSVALEDNGNRLAPMRGFCSESSPREDPKSGQVRPRSLSSPCASFELRVSTDSPRSRPPGRASFVPQPGRFGSLYSRNLLVWSHDDGRL